jgi:hypothetical protein
LFGEIFHLHPVLDLPRRKVVVAPATVPLHTTTESHATCLTELVVVAGSFEESVLNGRLEPVSTVHGFTAELGASGSFVPKHLVVPVTVFFYTLGDNDKVSSPYLVQSSSRVRTE